MLFIMDACYGGTAIQRHFSPSAKRFIRDILCRYSQQVLPAGKANQAVADPGGPRPGHSIFTGHLLDGLEGAAAGTDSLITASGLMSYVYDKVARDYQSRQTPHYGFLDGDGDMIFDVSSTSENKTSWVDDQDILVSIPVASGWQAESLSATALADNVNEYLSDERYRILLHDTVSAEVRRVLERTGNEQFPLVGSPFNTNEFVNRLGRYEDAISNLVVIMSLLARWGESSHRKEMELVLSRLHESISPASGLASVLGMRWYPISYLSYVGGIAPLAADSYFNLTSVLLTPMRSSSYGKAKPIIVPLVEGILDVQRANVFESVPGYDRYYAPRSEYMFKSLQPHMEDCLFLGPEYEHQFDRFEVLVALVFADLTYEEGSRLWGPPGRFGWMVSKPDSPFDTVMREADVEGDDWGLLKVDFFQGSRARFEMIAAGYRELLANLRWH